MTIKDDRQSLLNNGPQLMRQAVLDGLAELDQFKPPASSIALAAAQARNNAEHEDRKVNGYIGTRNRAIDAWRKTPAGKADRNPKARIAYADEAASQGRVSRENKTGLTVEESARRKKDQDAEAHQRRKILMDSMSEEEKAAKRDKDAERKRLSRATKKIEQSKKSD